MNKMFGEWIYQFVLSSDIMDQEIWTRLSLPQIFVAYSGTERLDGKAETGHEEIINTIRSVVDQFKDKLEIVSWEDMTD